MSIDLDTAAASPFTDGNRSDASPKGHRRNTRFSESSLVEEGGEENVKVCVRVRPFNSRELELQRQCTTAPLRSVVAMPDGMAGRVVFFEKQPNSNEYRQADEFQYTKTFWSVPEEQQPHQFAPITQEDVYDSIGKPIIRYALAGFHNCVFAYGQTGSGKTHSMMGEFDGNITPQSGLIPRMCVELFEKVEAQRKVVEEGILKTAEIKFSAIEIYNEQVRDLFWKLTPGRTKQHSLKIRKHPADGSFFVDQLTVLRPTTWLECLKFIDKAVEERTVAATDMNDESSRSHCIFQIVLEQTETVHVVSDDPDERYAKPVTNKKVSKINLVDLAGSERLKKSNAQGQQLKEAAGINLSLTTLKKVIDALVVNSKEVNPKRHVLIPFRESSLTLLLADSLGGNSKTTMVACVSPHFDNQEETLLTLRYANRTGTIVNNARINEDSAAKQALRLKHEILELQRRLAEGPVDEELEDLQEEIELGRSALREMEEANRKIAMTAEDLRKKTRREEEALVSSAFYSALKMSLLQQQKEQMEQSAADIEGRIQQHREEMRTLTSAATEKEQEERTHARQLERLRRDAQENRMKELEQERQRSKLTHENNEVHRKMEKEMELRYAQKMVNTYRLKKAREQAKRELDQLLQEQENKLTEVISEAAEQYEMQVRQFADAETIVHQQTTKIEKEIRQFNLRRQEAENDSAALMNTIRIVERTHIETMQAIERDWKERSNEAKEQYEAEIHKVDELFFEEQKKREANFENIAADENVSREEEIRELEKSIRESESFWNRKVATILENKADEMDVMLRELKQHHAILAAKTRKEFEERISFLVRTLQTLQSLESDHDKAIAALERSIAPLVHLHDAVCCGTDVGSSQAYLSVKYHGYSSEFIAIKRLLMRYDGDVVSVKTSALLPSAGITLPDEKSPVPAHPAPSLTVKPSIVASPNLGSPLKSPHVATQAKSHPTPQQSPLSRAKAASPGTARVVPPISPLFPMTPVGRIKLSKPSNDVGASAIATPTAARISSAPTFSSPFDLSPVPKVPSVSRKL